MARSDPSLPQWQALYQAAVGFKDIAAWTWMYDSDIFGVQNPESGEVGYCCVMGNLGEHFALGVYLGSQGLEGYLKLRSGDVPNDAMGLLAHQKLLMASYEDRDRLSNQDRETIRRLGLKFRGRQSWPLFRNYDPGYYPWYLSAGEVEYLTLALQQTTEVALRFKEHPDMFNGPQEGILLVRVPTRKGQGYRWEDEWLAPVPLKEKQPEVEVPVEAIRRVKKVATGQRGTWECSLFRFPEAVRDEQGRPFYPYACLWMERRSGLILDTQVLNPWEVGSELLTQFLELLAQQQIRPKQIMVDRGETFRLLRPVAFELGIALRQVERLREAERAKASLLDSLTRGLR